MRIKKEEVRKVFDDNIVNIEDVLVIESDKNNDLCVQCTLILDNDDGYYNEYLGFVCNEIYERDCFKCKSDFLKSIKDGLYAEDFK